MNHKYEMIDIEKCHILERNPQYLSEKTMNALKKSIEKDGFVSPILVTKIENGYRVVSGNHRMLAAKEVGLKKIPAVIAELKEKDIKRLALNLNFIHGEPPAELIAPFILELDDETKSELFICDKLSKDLERFGIELEKALDNELPSFVNNESRKTLPNCKCPKCGKYHVGL